MKQKIVFWVEDYFYNPSFFQILLSFFLSPISFLYCFIVYIRFLLSKEEDLGISVIGIGNLNVGGSGKTPLITSLAKRYNNVAIILRGYGRKSQGLVVVKANNSILCDVNLSGDEAMIYATKLDDVIVIVSEDRKKGIQKAKALGAKIVFLDDAYSKHNIAKLDILIEVDSKNTKCLPSGPFREKLYKKKSVLILKENKDFKRVVTLKDKNAKMSLVTAIARPQRLDKYLPALESKNYFEDHHNFTKKELEKVLLKDGSDSLLVTYKDYVKVKSFGLPLSLLDLDVVVDENIYQAIGAYIAKKNRNS